MSTLPMMRVDPYARKFGVEIECGLDGGTRRARELFPSWNVAHDGSGVELQTPPLQGEAGYEQIRSAMNILKEEGAFVTTYDGLHVHHDAPEFVDSPKNCLHVVRSWRNNQKSIHAMVAPRRRRSIACPTWNENYFQRLEDWADGHVDYLDVSRNDLNLASLDEHGTIELRLHEGTLDADVAIAWIRFGQKFLHETLKRVRPMKASESDVRLMSQIRLSKAAQRVLIEKRMGGHITEASNFRTRD